MDVSPIEYSINCGTIIKRTILHDEDFGVFISRIDYISNYQKGQITTAVRNVIIQHSHGGRQSQEDSTDNISYKKYCFANSKRTIDYLLTRR